MFNDKLTERLTDTMPAAFFADLVVLVVGKIEPIFRLVICPNSLAWPHDIVGCSMVRMCGLLREDNDLPDGRSSEMISSSFSSS